MYAPSWFFIKSDNKFQNQAQYIHKQIKAINKQPEEIKTVALRSIENCCWPLLPKNVLFFMAASEDISVREEAIKKIIALRENSQPVPSMGKRKKKSKEKRITQMAQFKVVTNAASWWELVNLEAEGVLECPMTLDIPTDELKEALMSGTPLLLPNDLPSHSQSVERSVKLVTEASGRVFGFERRHNYISTVVLCRRARPMFNNKATYIECFESLL